MEQKRCENKGCQRGSATLEAVVGFTAFLLAIFTILGMVNFCRAQMLVSAAMDAAAKEMAQYSYFYQMSGLRKIEQQLDNNGKNGRDNINEIIGTVDNLYSSFSGAVDQTIQEKNNVQDMINAGQFDASSLDTTIQNLDNSAKGISQGINAVSMAFQDVGNDPLLYMRSVVALLASEGAEVAKRVVAAPLTKSFVSKHFGANQEEANARLEALGIDGGLDGMKFSLSKLFSDDKQQDIELVVVYKVKLVQVFDWVVLEANVSKVSNCRAWLSGDDDNVKKIVAAPPAAGGTNEKPADGTESTEPENPTEATEATEPTEPYSEASTGNWALQHDPTFYDGSKRWEAFEDQLVADYYTNNAYGYLHYRETEGKTTGYGYSVEAKWEYEPYETMGGNVVDPGPHHIATQMRAKVLDTASKPEKLDGSVQEFGAYTHVIYVPENMPQDQYDRLVADAEKAKEEVYEIIQNDDTGVPKDLKINIVVVRSGGTYDYNSSEKDYNAGGTQ